MAISIDSKSIEALINKANISSCTYDGSNLELMFSDGNTAGGTFKVTVTVSSSNITVGVA